MQDTSGQPLQERLKKFRDDSNLRKSTVIKNWPKDKAFITVDDLVKDGFYCTGQGDRVQCCYCGGILSNWQPGDKVHEEHAKLFNLCPLMKQPYKYPEYADKLVRFNSFKNWPHQLKQKPDELADAGFFYIGHGDKTKCFWCGGILCDWEETDDPLKEHIKWFSDCLWLNIIKDREFIQRVLKEHNDRSKESQITESKTQSSVLDHVKTMGFKQESIDKAVNKLGRSISVGSLVKAILEIDENLATRNVSPQPESGEFMDIKSLKSENRDLKERSKCKICRNADVDMVFIPCGHLVCCKTCSGSVHKCPICRQEIARSVKVYW